MRNHLACILSLVVLAICGGPAFSQKDDPKEGAPLITPEAEKAIAAGLEYLAKAQAADGSWGTGQFQGNVGITGLAGLAFIAAGTQPGMGKYGKELGKAIDYVLSQEDPGTPGFFNGQGAVHGPMYNHGFGVLFLAEAHRTIGDAKLKAKVKEALERAVKLTVKAQNLQGGWRYRPVPQDADLTVSCGQIHLLRAARLAGVEVPKLTVDRAFEYVKRCQDKDSGGFRYQGEGQGPVGFARSAAGLAALYAVGAPVGDASWKKAVAFVARFKPAGKPLDGEARMHFFFGHYYAAGVLWETGDRDWYRAIRDELLKGALRQGDHWFDGTFCRHYCTAMSLNVLQAPRKVVPKAKAM